MRKPMAILLALIVCLGLTACAGPASSSAPEPGSASGAASQSEPQESPASEPDSSDGKGVELPAFQTTATIQEAVLYDQDGVKITATELSYGSDAAELGLILENNSDRNLTFISNSLGYSCNSVNGYMIADGYLNCEVAPGKKANESISLSYGQLMLYGIFEIADLEVGFDISDDEYNHIYTGPLAVTTSAAEGYDYSTLSFSRTMADKTLQQALGFSVPCFVQEPLWEQDGLSVVSGGWLTTREGETALLLEVKNNSDRSVAVTAGNICLNGLGIYGYDWSYDTINPGKTGIIDANLSELLDKNAWGLYGLEDIGSFSMTLNFKDDAGMEIGTAADVTVQNSHGAQSFDAQGQEVYSADGVRIVFKDLLEDASEYSDDLYAWMLVENDTPGEITVQVATDSLSLNGYMMDCLSSPVTVKSSASGVLKLQLWGSDLEENAIGSASEISGLEVGLELWQDGQMLGETTMQIQP